MVAISLDPSQGLIVDTSPLERATGAAAPLVGAVTLPDDMGLDLIKVPAGSELNLDLLVTAVTEGVLVSGEVSADIVGECARCLAPIEDGLTVPIQELYAYEGSTTDQTTDADEIARLKGDLLDLEPTVRDALVLEMASSPVCRDDCQGLCSDCGQPWAELPADHHHEKLDPRWAALEQLRGLTQDK
ncbi:YceD family protein [Haloglycomyces albus]|uniref:YceD family protein n=1 Tax=Haloglycomyces albus TaxID=526067 RepID=UPI00046CEB73|nr:YceD family protein [Haloglycomyces albus]